MIYGENLQKFREKESLSLKLQASISNELIREGQSISGTLQRKDLR